jgi:hypothetical protein
MGKKLLDAIILVLCICFLKTCIDAIEQTSVGQAAKSRLNLWWAALHDPKVGSPVSLSELTPLVPQSTSPARRKPLGYLLCMMSSCAS